MNDGIESYRERENINNSLLWNCVRVGKECMQTTTTNTRLCNWIKQENTRIISNAPGMHKNDDEFTQSVVFLFSFGLWKSFFFFHLYLAWFNQYLETPSSSIHSENQLFDWFRNFSSYQSVFERLDFVWLTIIINFYSGHLLIVVLKSTMRNSSTDVLWFSYWIIISIIYLY